MARLLADGHVSAAACEDGQFRYRLTPKGRDYAERTTASVCERLGITERDLQEAVAILRPSEPAGLFRAACRHLGIAPEEVQAALEAQAALENVAASDGAAPTPPPPPSPGGPAHGH